MKWLRTSTGMHFITKKYTKAIKNAAAQTNRDEGFTQQKKNHFMQLLFVNFLSFLHVFKNKMHEIPHKKIYLLQPAGLKCYQKFNESHFKIKLETVIFVKYLF